MYEYDMLILVHPISCMLCLIKNVTKISYIYD